MLREAFVRDMEQLHDEVLVMSSMVKQALRDSIKVLKKQDLIGARRLFAEDEAINAKRYAIEEAALLLIATQQPVASDMRQIAAIIELSGELERMGDYAKGIAKITLYIGHQPLIKPLVDIPTMCDKVIEMLELAVDAFSRHDIEAAYRIPERDDEVDELYNLVHREVITIMLEQPEKIDQANYLLWAAHNLERAADRVTNICERIIFTVTGEFVELDQVDLGTAR
ncbi:phosphate signaling complex protein PhoU [Chloroflexi bacterium TSY]|nr:phosphate signaling complex protein PhoU [Chloroflexi bacterium TSY]